MRGDFSTHQLVDLQWVTRTGLTPPRPGQDDGSHAVPGVSADTPSHSEYSSRLRHVHLCVNRPPYKWAGGQILCLVTSTPHAYFLPTTHALLFIEGLKQWCTCLSTYTYILTLFLYFSVYIFILCMKNTLLIIKNSISIFLYKHILNIKCMDYSYLLTYISLTFYSKICIRYTKEKQEQCNFILICFQFNSRGVDVSWLKSRFWENPFCDSVRLYFICYIWVGQDGRAEVADEGRTKNIWRQQTGNQQNEKVH